MANQTVIRGVWWLPDSPSDQVAGELRLAPDELPTLDLIGILGAVENFGQPWSSPIIHGQPVQGRPITLLGCHAMGQTFNVPGVMVQRIRAFDGALVGVHLASEDDELFDRIVVEVEHLGSLVGSVGPLVEPSFADGTVTGLEMRYVKPSALVAKVGDAAVHLAAGCATTQPSRGSVTVTETWAFQVILDSATTLSELARVWVERIRDLVSLCADRPCAVTVVRVGGSLTSVRTGASHDLAELHRSWIPTAGDGSQQLRPDDPVLKLPTERPAFDSLMKSWIGVCEELDVVLDLHFASDYAGFVYGETRFMNAVQAVEAYHRRRFAADPLPLEVENRARAIEACPEEVRPWLAEKLRYALEPGLRRRLKDLFAFSGAATEPFAASSKSRATLISRIVDTRNALTHWDPARPARLDGAELRSLSSLLRILLTSCLLRELGLSEAEVNSALAGNRRYQFEVGQIAGA